MSAAQPVCLLTFFGTLLCLDQEAGELCHRDLRAMGQNFPPVRFPQDGATVGLIGARLSVSVRPDPLEFTFAAGLRAGTVSLVRGNFHASAEPDGTITCHANQCLGWESFLPIRAQDAMILRQILEGGWNLDNIPITPEHMALAQNFILNLGPRRIDLLKSLPFAREAVPAARQAPRIWINALGNTANRALQFLAAAGIRHLLPEAEIQNILLPEWGIDVPSPPPPRSRTAWTGADTYHIDVPGLADCLRRGVVDAVVIESYTYHLDHYPPREIAKQLLGPTLSGADAAGFGADELVCSVRGAEILDGHHPDYLLLPPGYYRMLAEHTGLRLVFFGQLGDDAYTNSLRAAFPEAHFVPGRDPGHDFDTLRRSANIALSISTFAWAAAWLGAARRVVLPVGGMFSPVQHPDTMFLPLDEPEYEFCLLPHCKAVNLFTAPEDFFRQQDFLAANTRFVTPAELRQICARAKAFGKGCTDAGGFDPEFYLRTYPDVAASVAAGEQTALHHYLQLGRREGRQPLDFDAADYVRSHPEAALQIAEGFYPDALSHYLARGWAAGYRPRA